ncbi:MBL fold metallo-hydrolase [Streptomyces sp. NPDC088116]|uniref:MBL fold metallo-hydrolase n=1 Tax=Streptomyces sp. NPDC088116 TaxID=3365825 RepID=UPI0038265659
MTIHHLDCAGMCPAGGRLLLGSGRLFTGRFVSHCLLIESDDGLVLVDTGLGTADVADPRRLGLAFRAAMRPELAPDRTALTQIRALGLDPRDVRDIVLTHLDLDHAGGLADFPHARVHVLADELRAAEAPPTRGERVRYRPVQWAHHPHWVEYERPQEEWFGFQAVRLTMPAATPEILLLPMPGHTRGHCAVAVRSGEGWLLHCGDAFFSPADIHPGRPPRPPALSVVQRLLATDNSARRHNRLRLRELNRAQPDLIRLFCAHDPHEFHRLARTG